MSAIYPERVHALLDRYEKAGGDIGIEVIVMSTIRALEQILIDKGIATATELETMYLAVLGQIVAAQEAGGGG